MSDRLTVLTSKSVFTGTEDQPFEGFVAVRGNRIEAVGSAGEADSFLAQADEVIDCGDRTVMPGLVDVHTFYTGWALRSLGADLSEASDVDEVVALLRLLEGCPSRLCRRLWARPSRIARRRRRE